MKTAAVRLAVGVAGAVIFAGAGCQTPTPLVPTGSGGGSATGGTGGSATGGTGGSATGGTGGSGSGEVLLPSTSTGFVDDPVSGVIGAWFAYGDGVGSKVGMGDAGADNANSDCVLKGGFAPADCSQITAPVPGQPFAPSDIATSRQCTSGDAAVVMNKGGSPDYSDLWGAGIGLDFNNPGGDAGPAGFLDLSAYAGIEFDFSADVLPVNSIRVNFPFKTMHDTDAPYWMGDTNSSSPLTGTTNVPQHVKIAWTDIGGPFYLTQQTPPVDITKFPFDPTNVQGIQFQVFTNTKTTTPYSFCIANLALTKK